jgi:hypothetical protein
MDPITRIGQELFLEHSHVDGGWSRMERVERDSAALDPERSWLRRTIFRCTTCDQEVAVTTDDPEGDGGPTRR